MDGSTLIYQEIKNALDLRIFIPDNGNGYIKEKRLLLLASIEPRMDTIRAMVHILH